MSVQKNISHSLVLTYVPYINSTDNARPTEYTQHYSNVINFRMSSIDGLSWPVLGSPRG